jgi:adenylate cyclase
MHPSPPAAEMRRPFLIRLRPTLLTTIVGLVLLTALTIGGGAAILTLSVTRTLIDQARTDAVTAAREETRQLFNEPPRIARELAASAHRGALQLTDRQRLVGLLAEMLRTEPRLAVIGYGNVDGNWYVAAERKADGAIVEYSVDPTVSGGVPMVVAAANGTSLPPQTSELKPYSVADRAWFKEGVARPGPMWSSFYQFTTGVAGITSMSRVMPPDGATPAGVFHVDLRITGIDEFLSLLRVGKRGAVFLVDRNGDRVATPAGPYVDRAAEALDSAVPRRSHATLATPARILLGSRLYEVMFEPVPTDQKIGLSVGVVVDVRDITGGAYMHALTAAGVALIVLLLAALSGRALSSRIAAPIGTIARDLAQVGRFNISRDPAPQSFIREVSELGSSVDAMKASLRSFARYVPTDLVRRLLAAGSEAELGGEIRRLTIHFSDVADFTAMSEGIEPDRLVEAMGRYFELMTGALARHGGTVDKFMGDGIMAFFNAPEELPEHPRQACLAALEAQSLLAQLAADTTPGEPVFHARIGLGTGEVLVGNIGTPERFAYTLLGDEVNLASRLEGLNKLYGTAIIASAAVMDEAGGGFEWRRLDRVAVKGRTQGTLVCELLGQKGSVPADILAARDAYERALDAYFAADFVRAGDLFDEAARLRPGDLGAPMMRERAHELADDPPLTWSGVHVMEEK